MRLRARVAFAVAAACAVVATGLVLLLGLPGVPFSAGACLLILVVLYLDDHRGFYARSSGKETAHLNAGQTLTLIALFMAGLIASLIKWLDTAPIE